MSSILTIILNAIASSLAKILTETLSVAKELLKFLNYCKEEKKKEKEEKKIREYNEKVKDACDNGNVEDLLNLWEKFWYSLLFVAF